MDEPAPIPCHLVAFWRSARPDLDPHRRWRFVSVRAPATPARRRSRRWFLDQLDGTVGTLEAVYALLDFGLGPGGPGEEVCEFWPGYSESNPDHGVIAVGDPERPPLVGVLRFYPVPDKGRP